MSFSESKYVIQALKCYSNKKNNILSFVFVHSDSFTQVLL